MAQLSVQSFCVGVLVTSTRLHPQKHLRHDRGEAPAAAAQEDAQQHTARTLKTLQNRSRVSRTECVLTKQTKTSWRTPSQRPPWNRTPLCAGPTESPAGRRLRLQPPMPHPVPAPTKTSPHYSGRAAETPGAPSVLHPVSQLAAPTAGGSSVPATAATLLHAAAYRETQLRHFRKHTRPGR